MEGNKEHYIEFLIKNDIDNIFTHIFAEDQPLCDRAVEKIGWEFFMNFFRDWYY